MKMMAKDNGQENQCNNFNYIFVMLSFSKISV